MDVAKFAPLAVLEDAKVVAAADVLIVAKIHAKVAVKVVAEEGVPVCQGFNYLQNQINCTICR